MFQMTTTLAAAESTTPPPDIWSQKSGIYLGFKMRVGDKEPITIHQNFIYKGARHILTFGPNSSGKTRRLLVPNLCGNLLDWSVVVVDPKGELCKMSREYRLNRDDDGNPRNKVIVLNPYKLFGIPSDGFNPIMSLDPKADDFPDDALNLADAVIKVSGSERDPHWTNSAQDLITTLIMFARITANIVYSRTGEIADFRGHFGYVRECLGYDADHFKELIKEIVDTAESEEYYCPELATKANRWKSIGNDNKELNSIISTALTQTRWLDSRPIKRDLLRGTHDLSKLKEQPTTLYLILPANRLATQSSWLRLIIVSIVQSLMKDATKPKTPTLLMLEEMAQLGNLAVLENNIALMRGYGIKLWGIYQDMAQIQDIYSKRWESFVGNSGVVNAFAPQDVVTAEYLSKRSGVKTISLKNSSTTTTVHGLEPTKAGISLNQTQRPVLYPQDIRGMDDGVMVTFTHAIKQEDKNKTERGLSIKAENSNFMYAPFYTNLDGFTDIAKLDPSL
jgi:type IV secretion system protein VirD4